MRIKRHCKNCGAVIDMSKDRHYVVKVQAGDNALIRSSYSYADAYDCQECGRQYLAGFREIHKLEEEK